MYCASCGVELQKGVEKCPLCGLPVHPDIKEEKEDAPYPAFIANEAPISRSMIFVMTMILLIPMAICPAIDLSIHHRIIWSGYVIGGILCAYLLLFLPFWFKKRNPVVFFPIAMAGVTIFLLYIDLHTRGNWFLSFAFPTTMVFSLITETMIILLRYLVGERKSRIAVILGAGAISYGFLCVLIEFFIMVSFQVSMVCWSFIPFIALSILGILFIVIGLNKKVRDSLYKRFFI